MTNETTASQPKSIGDPELRASAMVWKFSADADDSDAAYRKLTDYIDSRAPAAQASATIQASPQVLATGGITKPVAEHDDSLILSRDAFNSPLCYSLYKSEVESYRRALQIAAPIQEAVMVADGTNWKMVMDLIADELEKKSNMNEISQFTALCIEFDRRAAPMVADPAGVVVAKLRDELLSMSATSTTDGLMLPRAEVERIVMAASSAALAATVKAIPSEAQYWIAAAADFVESINASQPEIAAPTLALELRRLAAPLADKTGGGE